MHLALEVPRAALSNSNLVCAACVTFNFPAATCFKTKKKQVRFILTIYFLLPTTCQTVLFPRLQPCWAVSMRAGDSLAFPASSELGLTVPSRQWQLPRAGQAGNVACTCPPQHGGSPSAHLQGLLVGLPGGGGRRGGEGGMEEADARPAERQRH